MSFLDALTPSFRVPAECVVLVGDDQHEMSDLYDYLTEVRVESSRKDAATARLQFETRRDEQGHFIVQDDPDIAAWQPIMISAAFGSRTEEVFRGYIREVKAEYPEDPARPTVTGAASTDVTRPACNPVSTVSVARVLLSSTGGGGMSGLSHRE